MSIDAMKQALEALGYGYDAARCTAAVETIRNAESALRAAIEVAERQEPFGFYEEDFGFNFPGFFSNQKELLSLGKLLPLYTTQQPAIPDGMVLVPMEPTEEEIEAPRYLFQALELGIKNIQDIRKHLERCGVDISCTPEWFRNDSGHLTKAGKAIVVRSLMLATAPKPGDKE